MVESNTNIIFTLKDPFDYKGWQTSLNSLRNKIKQTRKLNQKSKTKQMYSTYQLHIVGLKKFTLYPFAKDEGDINGRLLVNINVNSLYPYGQCYFYPQGNNKKSFAIPADRIFDKNQIKKQNGQYTQYYYKTVETSWNYTTNNSDLAHILGPLIAEQLRFNFYQLVPLDSRNSWQNIYKSLWTTQYTDYYNNWNKEYSSSKYKQDGKIDKNKNLKLYLKQIKENTQIEPQKKNEGVKQKKEREVRQKQAKMLKDKKDKEQKKDKKDKEQKPQQKKDKKQQKNEKKETKQKQNK